MNRAEAEAITEPREMRKHLREICRQGHPFLDNGMSGTSYTGALIYNVQRWAENCGWTGEDLYTAMAFRLALYCQITEKALLEKARTEPPAPIIVTPR